MNEFFQERAALYVSGMMTAQEREEFELVLEFHDELRAFANELAEVSASVTLAGLRSTRFRPTLEGKARILQAVSTRTQQVTADGVVVSGTDGLVQWINPAFTAMCGYTLEELRGKKLGPILQGEKTDRQTAERLRLAVRACRPCREVILNYRKNGEPYLSEIAMTPILDAAGQPMLLAAREREVVDHALA
jgi:PAS domain S-box-containing protein